VGALPIPPDTTDDELVALWLHGKSPNTMRAYGADLADFRAFTGKRLARHVPFGSAALRGQPGGRAGHPGAAPAGAQVTAVVCGHLGHASIATTSRYLHVRPEKSSGDYLAL
jgi:hypothetical protein